MSSPFHQKDAGATIAPLEVFARDWSPMPEGKPVSCNHAVRTSLALEIAHQLARALPGLVLKGGTALQARLLWPPRRASVDIDVEWPDPHEVMDALHAFVGRFVHTPVTLDSLVALPFAHATYVRFAGEDGPEITIRIDVSPPGSSTELSEPWEDRPAPWAGSTEIRVPSFEAQAAQKLLLAAPAEFGRDLSDHRGRQNLCKDLFDLHCLGALDLDAQAVQQAADLEVRTKATYLEGVWHRDRVVEGALTTWRMFAHPRQGCPPEVDPLWRAYLRMRPVVRAPFAEGDLRIAAGCAHHAVRTLFGKDFDWSDSWTPARSRGRRRAWAGKRQIETVLDVADDFGEARGLREAWARTATSKAQR